MMDRRQFILTTGALGLASSIPAFARATNGNVLVLGGTRYFGPIIVEELLKKGLSVTLFNRGKTNPHLFPQLPKIRGDRELPNGEGLSALKTNKTQWDWVIDTWQGSSKCVEDTAKLLVDRTPQYQYVSTVSVYDDWNQIGITEDASLNPLPTSKEPIVSSNRYAIRKTFSEQVLNQVLPKRNTCFRSHGMRGYPTSAPKHEPYWQVKVKRGSDLVLPSDISHYQVTDMVSLAKFMVHCGLHQKMGPYNVCYPPMLFKEFIGNIVKTLNSKVRLHWIPQDFLLKNDVKIMREEPAGRYRFDVSKAIMDGLVNRPTSELLSDQLQGYFQRNPSDDFLFGKDGTSTITSKREQEIIKLWRTQV
jgi:2'-hydroxyisoflavone reductase